MNGRRSILINTKTIHGKSLRKLRTIKAHFIAVHISIFFFNSIKREKKKIFKAFKREQNTCYF